MQTLVFVLMLLVCFNFLLKQTYNKRWAVGITTLACVLWTGLSWPYAILQSKTQIAVILSVEICMQLAFCLLAVHLMTGGTVPRRTLWIYRFLRWFPGFLIFPVLFSGLVALIFSFPGTSFSLLAWSMAGGVLLGIPLCTVLLRRLLPEKEIRLELLFLTHALTAILGIVATVNGRTAMDGTGDVDWKAFLGLSGLIVAGVFLGLLLYRYRLSKRKKL